jgi:hypothetical protein
MPCTSYAPRCRKQLQLYCIERRHNTCPSSAAGLAALCAALFGGGGLPIIQIFLAFPTQKHCPDEKKKKTSLAPPLPRTLTRQSDCRWRKPQIAVRWSSFPSLSMLLWSRFGADTRPRARRRSSRCDSGTPHRLGSGARRRLYAPKPCERLRRR